MIGTTQAAIYLDEIDNVDLTDSQNTSISGNDSTLPASKPIVLDEAKTSTEPLNSGNMLIEDSTEEVEKTNPINQLPDLQRDAEFLMSLRWLYDQ